MGSSETSRRKANVVAAWTDMVALDPAGGDEFMVWKGWIAS